MTEPTIPADLQLPDITQELLTSLRGYAERATLGADWKVDIHAHLEPDCRCLSCYKDVSTFGLNIMTFCDEQPSGDSDCENQGFTLADADFIAAANPKTVLALLDRLAVQQEELAHARTALKEANRP